FVGADSAAAAAEAMIVILRDPAAAGARAAAARQRARAWSVAELAASYERIYCEVLERGVRAR
ncbi:MAG TPA: glycosyltransferase family 1 protein, partial [Myxococcota bacterium]|nr:glycosyltransferase family 1 protein [Myxococcota bacterium]